MTLVAPNHIESDTGRIVGRETAVEQGADSGKYLAKAGQILYSKIRPALNKVTIAVEDCLCSADMYAISFRPTSIHRYALYYMLARPFHSFATVTSMRVKMPKINREELAAVPWLVPPVEEQRAIADFLDRETAQIDALVAKQEEFVRLLRERRARSREGLSSYVNTGHRLRWSLVEIDQRAGARANDLPLMSVSIDWGVRRRDEVTAKPAQAEELTHYKVCLANDIVVNRMRAFQGALGAAPEDGVVSPDYAVLRAVAGVDSRWLAELMRTEAFVGEMTLRLRGIGGTDSGNVRTPRINTDDLLDIRADIPELGVQASEMKRLVAETAEADALIAKAQEHIVLAKERRAALITAAVTGQFHVSTAHKAS
jgi:type I restriction enzyme S subunit